MHITLLSGRHVLGPSLLRREGWKDGEEREEEKMFQREGGGAEMKGSDLNRKEGRRRQGGRGDRKDKENGNECMSDEGWNERGRGGTGRTR